MLIHLPIERCTPSVFMSALSYKAPEIAALPSIIMSLHGYYTTLQYMRRPYLLKIFLRKILTDIQYQSSLDTPAFNAFLSLFYVIQLILKGL